MICAPSGIERDDLQVVEQLAVLVGLVLARLEVRDRAVPRAAAMNVMPDVSMGSFMTDPASLSILTDTRPPSQSEHDEYVCNGSD